MDKKDKVFIIIVCILFFALLCAGGTAVYYKYKYDKLVSENGRMLDAARERAAVLTDTLTRAREEVGAIGESLSRQRTSVSELRELISEVKTRYEKMENLLNNARDNDCDIYSGDSYINSSTGE